ncbi:MAG: c-type cytochrome [Terracidiphilus sp.]
MKPSSLLPSAVAVAFLAAAVLTSAQTPQAQPLAGAPPQAGARPMRNYPAPTNLKVLPKDLTGQQVRDIMETWAGSLGVHCDTCHMADPKNPGPNGRPRLNFADDSKLDKQIARIMYTMTGQINKDYISKTKQMDPDAMDMTVTCGTCHRGHEMPETYVIPPEGPRGGQGMPAGGAAPPPAGTPPPSN